MFLSAVTPEKLNLFFEKLNEYAAPSLLRDGVWRADYRRLRVAALKR